MIEAENQDEAEKLIQENDICNFLLEEEIFELDQFRIALDSKKRKDQLGRSIHPIHHLDEFQEYKLRKNKYNHIFNDFLQCMIDRKELFEKMDKAENKNNDPTNLYDEIEIITLEPYEKKTVRFFYVGEMPK